MFLSQAACPARHVASRTRVSFFSAEPGLIGRRLLPVLAAAALVAALGRVPHQSATAPDAGTSPVIVQDADAGALRDKAEAMRAQLLRTPGVGAVTITGLRQQRLVVDYTTPHLARFGLTQADLAASLPVDEGQSRPGHLALQPLAAPESLQEAASLPIHAGGRVFRLGDVALVCRAPLDPPVSTMTVEGRPAAQLNVTRSR